MPHIASQMEARFALVRADRDKSPPREAFAPRAAEHICELNAVHPFREGNGRTQRPFLERLAAKSGHAIDLRLIRPAEWNRASIDSFREGSYDAMRQVIIAALA